MSRSSDEDLLLLLSDRLAARGGVGWRGCALPYNIVVSGGLAVGGCGADGCSPKGLLNNRDNKP
jgi:hypothetical protein